MLNKDSKKILLIGTFLMQATLAGTCMTASNILLLACIETLMLLIQMFCMYEITKNIANFPNVFLLISYIFNVPTIFLGEIFNYNGVLFYQYRYFQNTIVSESLKYYNIITFFLWAGALTSARYKNQFSYISLKNQYKLSEIKLTGIIFMIIGFFPNMYIALEKYSIRINGSYIDTYEMDMSGIGILAYCFYFGAILCMYSCRNKISAIKIVIMCIPCMLLNMLSGHRYDSICLAVVLIYLYVIRVEKLQWKKMGLYLILFLALIVCINIMGSIRDMRYSTSTDLIFDKIKNFDSENPILGFFAEFGNTLRTLLLVEKYVPDSVKYANGMTYIKFWVKAIPHLNNYLNIDLRECEVARYLPRNYNIGGSWIAEVFYNFNYWGIFFAILLGRLLSKIELILSQGSYKKVIFYINILFPTIAFIRDHIAVYRYGLYFTFASYLMLYVIKKVEIVGK